jgi:hypothetical protein
VIIAAPLYFAWEILQMPGYVVPGNWSLRIAGCAAATVGDVTIMLGLGWLATIVFRDSRWFEPPRLSRYAFIVIGAVAVNIAGEWLAVGTLGLWSYSPRQPTVPWLGTGLFALLQALVLPPLTFSCLARWDRRSRTAPGR